jgi:glycosyltransferase involved in cell wall biosynthesis
LDKFFFSVIIPTFQDWDRLQRCLESLNQQSLDKGKFEIIVVNNKPDAQVPIFDLPENAILVSESKPGSYAARNTGLKLAKGDVIAFTDSDCLVDRCWLESAKEIFLQQKDIERIAGKINLIFKKEKKSAVECYELVYAFDQKDNVRKGLAVTANFLAKKSLFDRLGFFDENLFSGGDYQWNRIASKVGSKIVYSETTLVSHPARHTFDELRKKAKRVAAGQFGTQIQKENYFPALLKLIYELRPPVFEFKKIFSNDQLGFFEKVKVWWIRYWFRSSKTIEQFKIKVAGKRPENG